MSDNTPNTPETPEPQGQTPKASGVDESRLFAFLAYLLSIIGVLIVILTKKEDRYAVYHAKQSLVLFIGCVIAGIVMALPIPVIAQLVSSLLYLLLFVLWVIGIINSLTGQQKPLPIIGQFGDQFNF
ncbi:MAG TPA: DUF4870 domain-containing protein [Armatimonadota bacterium]|nr:DUF4870 domain-containing protein [Armatimonadota bacterium]